MDRVEVIVENRLGRRFTVVRRCTTFLITFVFFRSFEGKGGSSSTATDWTPLAHNLMFVGCAGSRGVVWSETGGEISLERSFYVTL